jgi:hypothetical protein
MIMLDDAVKARQRADDVQVLDVAQILERSLAATTASGATPAEAGGDDGQ